MLKEGASARFLEMGGYRPGQYGRGRHKDRPQVYRHGEGRAFLQDSCRENSQGKGRTGLNGLWDALHGQ